MSPLIPFARDALHLTIWPKFEEIFEAFAPSDGTPGARKILIRSCNGAGKTAALAAICNWYFCTYNDSIVLTTASSWMQVKRNLWGEIRKQARVGKLYPDPNNAKKLLKLSETAIKPDDKHFMIGISPDIPENAMGFHAPHLLIAIDEATGVSQEIMDALLGNTTGADSQIVMICNPINKQSYPYEAELSGKWKLITISAFDHPNVKNNTNAIPGAVTQDWIRDRLESWSEVTNDTNGIHADWLEHSYRITPLVQARILGEWAQLEDIGFISPDLIERRIVTSRSTAESTSKLRALGVDIARGHGQDLTVYASFDVHEDGPDIQLRFDMTKFDDLMATADRIREKYLECQANGIELVIAVDDTGLGGGVCDKLKHDNIPHFAVNFGHKPIGLFRDKPIANARAEMYFLLERELRDGKILLLDYERLHRELAAIHLDVSQTNGAYKMEDKSDTRKRLGRSPDYADATALARYALKLRNRGDQKWAL